MTRLTTLLAVILLASTLPAKVGQVPYTSPYTALYVFGDTSCDTGASFPYADGPTAIAYLARRLAIPFTYCVAPDANGTPSLPRA